MVAGIGTGTGVIPRVVDAGAPARENGNVSVFPSATSNYVSAPHHPHCQYV